jgi:hypothetical protein
VLYLQALTLLRLRVSFAIRKTVNSAQWVVVSKEPHLRAAVSRRSLDALNARKRKRRCCQRAYGMAEAMPFRIAPLRMDQR